jgi:predicted nucleotide-binding protein
MNDKASIEKPELVVFSSGKVAQSGVTDAIRDELARRDFSVTLWKEGFFPANEQALRAFLKKLLCFDAAVLVLGDDDIRLGRPTAPTSSTCRATT